MARINLKKLILRNKETAAILQQLIAQSGKVIAIADNKGKWLMGNPLDDETPFQLIEFGGTEVGRIYGSEGVKPIADLIQFLVNQEQERKKLGTEILDLYREVNLMYNFAQKLGETINQAGIAQLTLEETNNLISATGGMVALFQEDNKQVDLVAEFGNSIVKEETLIDQNNFYRQLMNKKEAGIINDSKNADGTVISILYSPLKVKNHQLGIILLVNDKGDDYTAADLKLLSTLSIQSAAAIESAQLYEKNLREAQERETAIRILHEAASRFVPNEFIKSLGYEQITQVTLGDSIEKEVTVFFSDIRGYTSLSEKMTPAETFQLVNSFNNKMGPIILRNKGFINQYLGDGIMAIFPYSPSDAIKASVEMHEELQRYNIRREQKNREPIRVGIGLHTGPLIMGITGDHQRLDATTISDTVNTAARIESLTKYYGVNILLTESCVSKLDAEAKNKLYNNFSLRYLGKVQVKGKKQAIKIHECYNGDLPEVIQSKNEYHSDFESALQNFHEQKFTNAAAILGQIVLKNPKDKTACLFFNKANQLMLSGGGEGWTGVEMMSVK
ncbi:MAG: adenylate/guanylate cyclase domain-containing protein [Saprospiraceae bacterium]